MAKKVVVHLVDDIDGGVAAETVNFGLDGVQYEIDLTEENAAELRASLERWIAGARRASGRRSTREAGRGTRRPASASDASKIRLWARDQGIEVSDRGRIPAELRERYENEVG
ncbi:MAG TPA: Lsr2 family protein [Actinomycetaceae bacterium]|nr:Lsr2 family protein [Actinomycetaceae bacterium]